MSKKTGKATSPKSNKAAKAIGSTLSKAAKNTAKEIKKKKTGKKSSSSSSSDKVEKAVRSVKEALQGVGKNVGKNVADVMNRRKGAANHQTTQKKSSSKIDKLAGSSIQTRDTGSGSFAERFREDLKDSEVGSKLQEMRQQYKAKENNENKRIQLPKEENYNPLVRTPVRMPDKDVSVGNLGRTKEELDRKASMRELARTDDKKWLGLSIDAAKEKYRNAGVGGFALQDDDGSGVTDFRSDSSKQKMTAIADSMIAGWNSIPEGERVAAADYIIQAYGINDKTRDIVMSAYESASTEDKLKLLKTARYIDGNSADVTKMQRMAQSSGNFERAVESDLKNTSHSEKVENFERDAQKAVINDYRYENEKTKLIQDWAKEHNNASEALKSQVEQSVEGIFTNAYDAVVMAWSDLIMAGQQDSVFDGIDPTRGVKDVKSIGDGFATVGSNVLHDLFRIAGLPISLISKASYTEKEAREITEKLMSVTDWYHEDVRRNMIALDSGDMSSMQKDIIEVTGAVIDQIPSIVVSVAASPAAGMATFGVEAGGMYARSAYENGATLEDSVRFGLSAAAMEMVTEKMFTGFGYMGKGFVSEAAKDTIKNALKSSGFDKSVSGNILRRVLAGGGEATEEMVMEIVQPYLERATYDPNAENANLQEILHSGALGFAVAEILGLPANLLNTSQAVAERQNKKQAERLVREQINEMMQDAVNKGKLSESDVSNINAQIKDIRQGKGVLTESQAESETKITGENLDKVYADFDEARKAMQTEAKGKADGETVSARFMQDGKVKLWRAAVRDGRIGLTQEGTVTESENAKYAAKANKIAAATNEAERTGYQLNVRDEIVEQVSELSKVFGKEIAFASKEGAVHGYEENGKIYVNVNSSQSPAAAVVAHEMTHMLEETGSYAALRDMVYRHYGSSVESKRDEILRNYEAAGVSLDTAKNESGYDEVDTEVMAAFVEEKLLTDYDTILSTVKTDRTLGERILDWLNKVLTKITGTKEQRFLIDARKKWSRALKEERKENKKAPERTGERERYSISDNLENDLTKVKDGSFRGEHGEVYIGETSKFLEEVIGADPISVTMPAAKAYSAMATKEEAKKDGRYNETMNYHGLGVNGLMEILERAENPLIAFAATNEKGQADRSNRIVLVTDKRIGKGLGVVINEVSTTALVQGKMVDVNKTITVYGRKKISSDISSALLDGRLLYVDKKRSQNLAVLLGSNYQAAVQGIDFNKNIQQFWDNVNRKSKKSSAKVKKSNARYSIGTSDLKVDKETRDLITAHNAAMREVFYNRSRSDQTELWDMIKDEMAHILRTGAAQRKAVNEIVELAYDTGYRIARRENEAVNTWGKGIYIPEKYMGEMASLGGLKAVNNKLMGSGLYFTYRQKKQDSNVNYGSLDEAYSVLSESNPILAETTDPAEQVREIVDLFGSQNRRQSLRELDEEAYEMGEDSEPYLTDIRNAVEEAMDDIATMARYKMIQAARKSGKAEGRKEGAKEQKKAQQKADEATMREYDKLRKKLAEDERKDAEATMRMHDKLIREVREEDRKLSEKEKREIRQGIRKKEKEWDKEMKRQASDFKREQKKSERNAETNLESVLRQAKKERKQLERQLNEPQKKEMQQKRREVDTARRKERIETAKAEYRRNNPPPATGTTKDLYQKNNAARGIVERFRQEAITGLVKSGAFTETNGDVLLDENRQEVATRISGTDSWDISNRKNTYTPSWGLTVLAEKEGFDVDEFYTVYSVISDMRTARNASGDLEYHKADVVQYIGTLDLTAKQKDFLYFDCAKYAYSTKPTFMDGGKTKVKAGNRRGHMVEALDNIALDMFRSKQNDLADMEQSNQIQPEDIAAFVDAVFGEELSIEKEAYTRYFMELVVDYAGRMETVRLAERTNLLTDKPQDKSKTREKILRAYRQSKRMLLAEGEAFERMSDKVGDPLLTARYYGAKNASSIASEMIYGKTQRDLGGQNKGKSLYEIFRPVFRADEKANRHENMELLTELVNCRHDIYRLQHDKGYTGHSVEECEEIVKRISEAHPELLKVADELADYGKTLLRMCVESGRISEDEYQYFTTKYPYYVPTFRVRSDEYIDRQGRVVRRDTKVIRTAKGGNSAVLPLFDQFVRRTQEIVKACKKNQLATELVRASMMDEDGEYIAAITSAEKGQPKDLNKLEDEISELGEIEDRGTARRETAKDSIIPWYSNGVKYDIDVIDKGLLYGWDRISYRMNEIALGTAVRKLNNIRRGVLTQYNPTFWLTNGIKDIQDMYLYNQHAQRLPRFHMIAAKTMFAGSAQGTRTAKKLSKREMDEMRKNEERLQEYFSFGVRASSIFEYDKTKAGARSRGRRAFEGFKKYTIDAFDGLNFMVEQTPRFAVYLETVDRLEKQRKKGKNTYTDEEIRTIAGYQATDATLNFGRSGTIIKGMNTYGFTFLNAGVQGMDRFRRVFTQAVNTDSKAVVALNVIGLMIKMAVVGLGWNWFTDNLYVSGGEYMDAIRRALYGDDEEELEKIMKEYAEMADYQRMNYLLLYLDGTWIRIPKGRVAEFFYSFVYNGNKVLSGEDDWLDFIAAQWDVASETIFFSNPLTNNIAGPLIDIWLRNKDNWGNDIVSEYEDMGDGMHYLEYDEDTTDLAIKIAELGHYLTGTLFGEESSRILDISPKKLDYVIEQYFGSYANMIMPFLNKEQKVSDNLLGAIESMAKKFYIDPNASNRLAGDYYDLKEEYERIANAHDGDSPYAVASKIFNDYGDFLKEERNNIKAIENDTSLSRKERLEKISAIRKEMNQLYRDGMADAKSVLEYARENYGLEGIDNSTLYETWIKENKSTDWRTNMATKSETEKLNKYRNLGMTDETAYLIMDTFDELEPYEGKESVSSYQKMEAIAGLGLSAEQEKAAVGAALTSEKQYAKYLSMCDHVSSISASKWCQFQDALAAADAADDGNGYYNKDEKKAALDSCNFTNAERAVFWQSLDSKIGSKDYTTQWKAGRNIYDKSVAAKMIDSYMERIANADAAKAATNQSVTNSVFPVGTDNYRISSNIGYRSAKSTNGVGSKYHHGIDISTKGVADVPAYSVTSGEVVAIGWGGGYGNRIIIQNDDGYASLYGHLASYDSNLKVGDKVTTGQQIGIIGTTGNSTGIHLHFEVRTDWKDGDSWIDPNTVYDIDGDGELKGSSVAASMGTGTANASYTGSGSSGSSGSRKSGGSSKKTTASSSANLATTLSSTQRRTTGYDSIAKTANSRSSGVYLPTSKKTVTTASSGNVRGRSTRAEGYGSGGTYLPRAKQYNAIRNRSISSSVATSKRTGRTGGSLWDENVLG